jgi:hypothetical protein
MTIIQMVILLIIGLLMTICYFKVAYSIDIKKAKKGLLGLFILTFLAYLSLVALAIEISEIHELREQLKNKCPEYEKIENVYRLKQ